VAVKVDNKESANALLVDYLFKEYQKAKTISGINVTQRLAFIKYIHVAAKILLKAGLIEQE
jgi:hypothetical protein